MLHLRFLPVGVKYGDIDHITPSAFQPGIRRKRIIRFHGSFRAVVNRLAGFVFLYQAADLVDLVSVPCKINIRPLGRVKRGDRMDDRVQIYFHLHKSVQFSRTPFGVYSCRKESYN